MLVLGFCSDCNIDQESIWQQHSQEVFSDQGATEDVQHRQRTEGARAWQVRRHAVQHDRGGSRTWRC